MSKRKKNSKTKDQGEASVNLTSMESGRQKETTLVKKIVLSILAAFILLLILFGVMGYQYVTTSLKPLDKENKTETLVEIPSGSSSKAIAGILQDEGIIKSATVFSYYIRMNNETGFQAGNYEFSPSMTLDSIIDQLQEGGTASKYEGTKILVKEGTSIDQIGDVIAENTEYSKEDFLAVIQNEAF